MFREYFREALQSGGAFVVLDTKTERIIGSTRFHGYDSEKSEVEIGWTFPARSHWGGQYNREMKHLMLDHAFKFVERVVFIVGENNVRSQKAMEKLGAIKAGLVKRASENGVGSNVKYVIRKADHGGKTQVETQARAIGKDHR